MEKEIQSPTLSRIESSPEQMQALQRVLEAAPGYSIRVSGYPPGPREAQSVLEALPPGMGQEDKFVFGLFLGSEMVGCVDLIRGYPRTECLRNLLLPFRRAAFISGIPPEHALQPPKAFEPKEAPNHGISSLDWIALTPTCGASY